MQVYSLNRSQSAVTVAHFGRSGPAKKASQKGGKHGGTGKRRKAAAGAKTLSRSKSGRSLPEHSVGSSAFSVNPSPYAAQLKLHSRKSTSRPGSKKQLRPLSKSDSRNRLQARTDAQKKNRNKKLVKEQAEYDRFRNSRAQHIKASEKYFLMGGSKKGKQSHNGAALGVSRQHEELTQATRAFGFAGSSPPVTTSGQAVMTTTYNAPMRNSVSQPLLFQASNDLYSDDEDTDDISVASSTGSSSSSRQQNQGQLAAVRRGSVPADELSLGITTAYQSRPTSMQLLTKKQAKALKKKNKKLAKQRPASAVPQNVESRVLKKSADAVAKQLLKQEQARQRPFSAVQAGSFGMDKHKRRMGVLGNTTGGESSVVVKRKVPLTVKNKQLSGSRPSSAALLQQSVKTQLLKSDPLNFINVKGDANSVISAKRLNATLRPQSAFTSLTIPKTQGGGGMYNAKKFRSIALELQIELKERCSKIKPDTKSTDLELLDVHRDVFERTAAHDVVFGTVLKRIFAFYDTYQGGEKQLQMTHQTLIEDNVKLHERLKGYQDAFEENMADSAALRVKMKSLESTISQQNSAARQQKREIKQLIRLLKEGPQNGDNAQDEIEFIKSGVRFGEGLESDDDEDTLAFHQVAHPKMNVADHEMVVKGMQDRIAQLETQCLAIQAEADVAKTRELAAVAGLRKLKETYATEHYYQQNGLFQNEEAAVTHGHGSRQPLQQEEMMSMTEQEAAVYHHEQAREYDEYMRDMQRQGYDTAALSEEEEEEEEEEEDEDDGVPMTEAEKKAFGLDSVDFDDEADDDSLYGDESGRDLDDAYDYEEMQAPALPEGITIPTLSLGKPMEMHLTEMEEEELERAEDEAREDEEKQAEYIEQQMRWHELNSQHNPDYTPEMQEQFLQQIQQQMQDQMMLYEPEDAAYPPQQYAQQQQQQQHPGPRRPRSS